VIALIWKDGDWLSLPGLPLGDRGFRYGHHVFESLVCRGGKLFFTESHKRNLREAARRCQLPSPPDFSIPALPGADGILRLYWTAGDGGPSDPVTCPRLIAAWEGGSNHEIGQPVRTMVLRLPVENCGPGSPLAGPGIKSGNYLLSCALLQKARAGGFDEALLFSPSGALVSACMANVAVCFEDRWLTPPCSAGARNGVVRQWLLDRKRIVEQSISLCEISRATSVCLMNSRSGVRPVVKFGSESFPSSPCPREWNLSLFSDV